MKELNISNGVYVEITYVLREDGPEGEELEVCPAEDPFGFTIGQDEVLPAFEAALMGKKGGDSFEFVLSEEDAYGPEDPEGFVEVPKSAFIVDGELDESIFEVDSVVPMETEDGEEMIGVVAEVQLNSVIVDFNHPFAGMPLHFAGEIKLISAAPPASN
jgi:FKBP-type peptidyl-prolyl cis-trans isomerase SlyD